MGFQDESESVSDEAAYLADNSGHKKNGTDLLDAQFAEWELAVNPFAALECYYGKVNRDIRDACMGEWIKHDSAIAPLYRHLQGGGTLDVALRKLDNKDGEFNCDRQRDSGYSY